MAKKAIHAAEEEVELNLTPMIDVVFNLIIFFMIITDLTQKDLEQLTLPKATQDQEDKNEEKEARVIINISKKVGKNEDIRNWRPGGPVRIKVKGQEYNLDELKDVLWEYAEMKRDMDHEMQPSEIFALIRCDKDIRWREVQWVMQAAADPEVRIYKIQFATAKQEDK